MMSLSCLFDTLCSILLALWLVLPCQAFIDDVLSRTGIGRKRHGWRILGRLGVRLLLRKIQIRNSTDCELSNGAEMQVTGSLSSSLSCFDS